MTDPPLPELFLIGAGKSGTTSLHYYVGQHPDVCMSDPKEPFFFDVNYERGTDWYASFFDHYDGEEVLGESTPSYLHNRYVIDRVRETVDDPKFLLVLRNPVDRAYSHWWMMRMHSGPKEENRSFPQTVEENIAAIDSKPRLPDEAERRQRLAERRGDARIERDYVEIGLYAKHVSRWFDVFPRDAFYILLSSDLRENPEEALTEVWAFIDLPQTATGLSTPRMNSKKTQEMKRVRTALQRVGIYDLWRYLPQRARDAAKGLTARLSTGDRPPMEQEVREKLADYYRPWNRKLEKMIDRDLSHWSKPPD